MTVRKKFLLSQEIANLLEELAMRNNTTQTDIIKEMIEERLSRAFQAAKIEAFKAIVFMPSGSLCEKNIQSIKTDRDV